MNTNNTLRSALHSPRFTLLLCALLAGPFIASAQYSIDWHKIAGGGGASTGGVYAVSGTIGQHDAGTMSGGNYSLTGGFWSLIQVVQTEGAPSLTIAYPSPGHAVVSWPETSGWQLEQTVALAGSPAPWGLVSLSIYQTNNSLVSVPITISPGNKFYRLHKP